MTPLFDVNGHPVLAVAGSGESFSDFKTQLDTAGFIGACAVGLPAKDGFEHAPYFEAARRQGFFPVAAWQDLPETACADRMAALVAMGYRAIKIHPRLSGLSVCDARFTTVLQLAAEANVVVFHCSYQFSGDAQHPVDPLPALMEATARAPSLKMVLLHGGSVELLRYIEAIRANRNFLLDLSMTLNRYAGSSLDQDIAFLFRRFDQRICIGSDYPDYQPAQVRARFETFSEGLEQDKRDNIGWRNITTLLDLAGQ